MRFPLLYYFHSFDHYSSVEYIIISVCERQAHSSLLQQWWIYFHTDTSQAHISQSLSVSIHFNSNNQIHLTILVLFLFIQSIFYVSCHLVSVEIQVLNIIFIIHKSSDTYIDWFDFFDVFFLLENRNWYVHIDWKIFS